MHKLLIKEILPFLTFIQNAKLHQNLSVYLIIVYDTSDLKEWSDCSRYCRFFCILHHLTLKPPFHCEQWCCLVRVYLSIYWQWHLKHPHSENKINLSQQIWLSRSFSSHRRNLHIRIHLAISLLLTSHSKFQKVHFYNLLSHQISADTLPQNTNSILWIRTKTIYEAFDRYSCLNMIIFAHHLHIRASIDDI